MNATKVRNPLRHTSKLALCLAAAFTLSAGSCTAVAQAPSQPSSHAAQSSQSSADIRPDPTEAPETHPWTIEQLLPLTVSEAWQMSGRNEDKFFDMVQDLAAFSAQKRNLVLPETEAAGRQAGELVKQRAKADHNQLLYAVVDHAVRTVGKPAPAAAATTSK